MKETIGEFILRKIKESNTTKSSVYKHLGLTTKGFENKLKVNNVSVDTYLSIANLLSFDPCEYFHRQEAETKDYVLREPQSEYRTIKKEEINLNELLKQNSELITIIKRLTEKP